MEFLYDVDPTVRVADGRVSPGVVRGGHGSCLPPRLGLRRHRRRGGTSPAGSRGGRPSAPSRSSSSVRQDGELDRPLQPLRPPGHAPRRRARGRPSASSAPTTPGPTPTTGRLLAVPHAAPVTMSTATSPLPPGLPGRGVARPRLRRRSPTEVAAAGRAASPTSNRSSPSTRARRTCNHWTAERRAGGVGRPTGSS